jgi:hypothetical protein
MYESVWKVNGERASNKKLGKCHAHRIDYLIVKRERVYGELIERELSCTEIK